MNQLFSNGRSAPMTPNSPAYTRVGLSNAATPSMDPMSLNPSMAGGMGGQGLGGFPNMANMDQQQLIAFMQMLSAQQPGQQRRGFSGSLFGGAAPTRV